MAGIADLIAMLKGGAGTGQDMSMLQGLGMQTPGQDAIDSSQVGQLMPGASGLNPMFAQQPSASQGGDPWSSLARFGAGMSKASGATYGPPKTFGEVLAGGTDAMEAGKDANLARQKTQAEINALGVKGAPDLEKQAQQVMLKKQMGLPLTPQEEAIGNTYDAFQNKMQTVTGPDQSLRQVPSQRPVFGAFNNPQGGGQPARPPIDPNMQRLQQLRQMKQQAGM